MYLRDGYLHPEKSFEDYIGFRGRMQSGPCQDMITDLTHGSDETTFKEADVTNRIKGCVGASSLDAAWSNLAMAQDYCVFVSGVFLDEPQGDWGAAYKKM